MEGNFHVHETSWCPGCGNFGIIDALREALEQLGKKPEEVLVVGGIGQAAKLPQYITTNGFCGLHGRALPPAVGAKIANKDLTVIVHSGDGDSYGEGGNHFIHNIRRNVDIAHFVHNNGIYGLTKGQASPTSNKGMVTSVQPLGNLLDPVNPLLMALTMGAAFVARGFSGDKVQLVDLMKEAIQYKGYAFIDILQPCISFNKINTYQWYKNRVYKLGPDHDMTDLGAAMKAAMDWEERIATGILYKVEKTSFHESIPMLKDGPPLVDILWTPSDAARFLKDFDS